MARRRRERATNKYASKLSTVAFFATVFIVAGCLVAGGLKLKAQKAYYASQEELYASMIVEQKARTEELKEQQKYVQTKQYIEEVARDQLHLVYPDEYVFVEK